MGEGTGTDEGRHSPGAAEEGKIVPKESRKASKIDKGKIIALGRAGWKVNDIAKEVGCSATTVRDVVRKELKQAKDV